MCMNDISLKQKLFLIISTIIFVCIFSGVNLLHPLNYARNIFDKDENIYMYDIFIQNSKEKERVSIDNLEEGDLNFCKEDNNNINCIIHFKNPTYIAISGSMYNNYDKPKATLDGKMVIPISQSIKNNMVWEKIYCTNNFFIKMDLETISLKQGSKIVISNSKIAKTIKLNIRE